jgi:NADP-dependent 3-hydroxy acid dehydrogenase YdfG
VPAALDVRDGIAMCAYAEQFVRQAQGIDLVIANAGVGEPDDLRW